MEAANVCPVCGASYNGSRACKQCGTEYAFVVSFVDLHALRIWQKTVMSKKREWESKQLNNSSGKTESSGGLHSDTADVPKGQFMLSVGRNGVIVLNTRTKQARKYSQLGNSFNLVDVAQISQSDTHCLFLLSDGTVRATGNNERQACNVTMLTNIRYAKATEHASYYVDNDNQVICRGTSPFKDILERQKSGIVQIACGKNHVAWLLDNGNVSIAVKSNETNTRLCAKERLTGEYGEWNIRVYKAPEDWKAITAIDAAEDYVAGLDAEGKLHLLGSVGSLDQKPNWNYPVTAIAAARNGVVGLTTDGKVLYYGRTHTGTGNTAKDVSQWYNIVCISASGSIVAALDQQGRLYVSGSSLIKKILVGSKTWKLDF